MVLYDESDLYLIYVKFLLNIRFSIKFGKFYIFFWGKIKVLELLKMGGVGGQPTYGKFFRDFFIV